MKRNRNVCMTTDLGKEYQNRVFNKFFQAAQMSWWYLLENWYSWSKEDLELFTRRMIENYRIINNDIKLGMQKVIDQTGIDPGSAGKSFPIKTRYKIWGGKPSHNLAACFIANSGAGWSVGVMLGIYTFLMPEYGYHVESIQETYEDFKWFVKNFDVNLTPEMIREYAEENIDHITEEVI